MALLFIGSGCAALVYEVVWFQQLQLVIGSTGISLGVLLGSFMGGMCLGSLLLPRYVSYEEHPLRVYAVLELCIGVLALVLLGVIPLVGSAYVAIVPSGFGSVLLRAVMAGVLLLPPTILMGATLPAISRYVEATPRGVSWMGFFYGGNIAGAVAGCLLAGFWLLREYDVVVATLVGVAINVIVAGLALLLAFAARYEPVAETVPEDRSGWGGRHRLVLIAIGLSGFAALGSEVVWTRLMALMLGATTYTFSIILAVFLAALGVGSAAGAYVSRHSTDPRRAFGLCQLGAALGVAWTAHAIAVQLPFWPINPSIATEAGYVFQLDLARAVWALTPAPLLWGASFPLAVAAAAEEGQDPGRLVGRVYAANTVGAIVGALLFGVVVVSWLGTESAQVVLLFSSVASGGLLLLGARSGRAADAYQRAEVSVEAAGGTAAGIAEEIADRIAAGTAGPARFGSDLAWRAAKDPEGGAGAIAPTSADADRSVAPSPLGLAPRALLATALLVAAIGLATTIEPVPPVLIAYGRYAATYDPPVALYVGEGRNSSITVTELSDGTRNLHISGKVVASTEPQDMRLQGMLGHLTALLHEDPKTVLIVGFGAGVTAGTFVTHPGIERIVIAEIEPLVVEQSSAYFRDANNDVLADPRVEVVYDDARHFLLTTDETFDLVTSDPIHPWMKGAAALYSEEYFELVRSRLNDGGVITQWVPLYESSTEAVKSEMATFFEVFPDGTVWGNTYDGGGYDVVMAARKGGLSVDVDAFVDRLMSPDHAFVAMDLTEVGFSRTMDLLGTYAASADDLTDWLADAEINRDRSLRLMYLAGLGLNNYTAASIYSEVLESRSFPDFLFRGDPGRLAVLRELMGFY